jgi:hypothetical protein
MVLQIPAEEEWKTLGQLDPYFGVLSDSRFRMENLNQTVRDEFFATGIWHVNNVLDVLKTDFGFVPRGTALDFGLRCRTNNQCSCCSL